MTRGNGGEQRVRRRLALFGLLTVFIAAIALPLAAGYYRGTPHAEEARHDSPRHRSDYWRAVRQGTSGYSAAPGQERDVLIQHGGQNWRQIRNGVIANAGPWLMGSVLLAIAVFYFVRGPVRLEARPGGERVKRWSLAERVLHWYVAILFIVLAVTGLSLLFGRAVLIPVLGKSGFAAYADIAIDVHNYVGPFFAAGVLIEIVAWIRHNLPDRSDWNWIKQWGGIFGRGTHPSSGRMNGGEKIWFWITTLVGGTVIVSGLVLDYPNFGQLRSTMQFANIIHGALAICWISVAFGHIYIGTIGTEGALEGMVSGEVSAEWARQHHDLWYAEITRAAEERERTTAARPPDG